MESHFFIIGTDVLSVMESSWSLSLTAAAIAGRRNIDTENLSQFAPSAARRLFVSQKKSFTAG